MAKTFTPEAIALGAKVLAQVEGDLPQARRNTALAADWLASVDPSYKGEPVTASESAQDTQRIITLGAALTERTAEVDRLRATLKPIEETLGQLGRALKSQTVGDLPLKVQNLLGQVDGLGKANREHLRTIDKLREELAATTDNTVAPLRREVATLRAELAKHQPAATPAPPQVKAEPTMAKPAPAAVPSIPTPPPGMDPGAWSSMTPAMRAYVLKSRPSSLEID